MDVAHEADEGPISERAAHSREHVGIAEAVEVHDREAGVRDDLRRRLPEGLDLEVQAASGFPHPAQEHEVVDQHNHLGHGDTKYIMPQVRGGVP